MPAESVRLQWKSTVLAHIQIVRIYTQISSDEVDSIFHRKELRIFSTSTSYTSEAHWSPACIRAVG